MDIAIRTRALTKRYGRHVGLDGLDLEVPAGEVFGFLGPNGAGKTTTIRLLLDLIRPSSGTAEVFGLDSHRDSLEIRRSIGYLPGELSLYERMTGAEILEYFGALRPSIDVAWRDELVERFGAQLDRPMRTLSRGNKQKIGLVQALMHRPRLLLLDEPTSGLDPIVQHEFHRVVAEAVEEGATVFLSSHVLSEVQHVTGHIGIVRAGRLVEIASVEDLVSRAPHRFELLFAAPVPAAAFEGLAGVRDLTVHGRTVRGVVTGSADALVKAAARFEVDAITSREPDLEEIFLDLYSERGVTGAERVRQDPA